VIAGGFQPLSQTLIWDDHPIDQVFSLTPL
jgi:hypothetical protein